MSLADDLDLLGAEGLSGQAIVVRVKSIDKQKLGQALGKHPAAAALLPAALAVVDFAPQETLKILLPFAVEEVRSRYGVDVGYEVTAAPPAPGKGGILGKLFVGALFGVAGTWAASHFGLVDTGRGLLQKVGL